MNQMIFFVPSLTFLELFTEIFLLELLTFSFNEIYYKHLARLGSIRVLGYINSIRVYLVKGLSLSWYYNYGKHYNYVDIS